MGDRAFRENKKHLAFGMMRLPMIGDEVDIEQTKQMVDLFLEQGFTYFDTAWMYCGHNSENATKEALVDRYPRNAFTLADKLHDGFIKTEEDRDRIASDIRRLGFDAETRELADTYLCKAQEALDSLPQAGLPNKIFTEALDFVRNRKA